MHDSFTPLGGLVPLFNIQLGEIIIGGVGAGLYGLLLFAISRLRRRTDGRPHARICRQEDRGQARSRWPCSRSCAAADDPRLHRLAAVIPPGLDGSLNQGPHGFPRSSTPSPRHRQQRLGLCRAHRQHALLQRDRAIAMFVGRFWMIIPALAIAGSLAAKKKCRRRPGTFPTTGGLCVGLVVGVILIVGGLTFFPALALGPHRRASRDARRHPVLRTSGADSMEATTFRRRHAGVGIVRSARSSGRRSGRPSPNSIRGR